MLVRIERSRIGPVGGDLVAVVAPAESGDDDARHALDAWVKSAGTVTHRTCSTCLKTHHDR